MGDSVDPAGQDAESTPALKGASGRAGAREAGLAAALAFAGLGVIAASAPPRVSSPTAPQPAEKLVVVPVGRRASAAARAAGAASITHRTVGLPATPFGPSQAGGIDPRGRSSRLESDSGAVPGAAVAPTSLAALLGAVANTSRAPAAPTGAARRALGDGSSPSAFASLPRDPASSVLSQFERGARTEAARPAPEPSRAESGGLVETLVSALVGGAAPSCPRGSRQGTGTAAVWAGDGSRSSANRPEDAGLGPAGRAGRADGGPATWGTGDLGRNGPTWAGDGAALSASLLDISALEGPRTGKAPSARLAAAAGASADAEGAEGAVPPTAPTQKRCRCKRSACLKMYCECFAAGGLCGPDCGCVGCHNTSAQAEDVRAAREIVLVKDPRAFDAKVTDVTGHRKGCRCRRSACQKRYCECFNAGVKCNPALCICTGCKNCSPDPAGGGAAGSTALARAHTAGSAVAPALGETAWGTYRGAALYGSGYAGAPHLQPSGWGSRSGSASPTRPGTAPRSPTTFFPTASSGPALPQTPQHIGHPRAPTGSDGDAVGDPGAGVGPAGRGRLPADSDDAVTSPAGGRPSNHPLARAFALALDPDEQAGISGRWSVPALEARRVPEPPAEEGAARKRPKRMASRGVAGAVAAHSAPWRVDLPSPPRKRAIPSRAGGAWPAAPPEHYAGPPAPAQAGDRARLTLLDRLAAPPPESTAGAKPPAVPPAVPAREPSYTLSSASSAGYSPRAGFAAAAAGAGISAIDEAGIAASTLFALSLAVE